MELSRGVGHYHSGLHMSTVFFGVHVSTPEYEVNTWRIAADGYGEKNVHSNFLPNESFVHYEQTAEFVSKEK